MDADTNYGYGCIYGFCIRDTDADMTYSTDFCSTAADLKFSTVRFLFQMPRHRSNSNFTSSSIFGYS